MLNAVPSGCSNERGWLRLCHVVLVILIIVQSFRLFQSVQYDTSEVRVHTSLQFVSSVVH